MATPKFSSVGSQAVVVSKGGGGFKTTKFFKLKDGESGIFRFLTDYVGVDTPDGEVTGGWLPTNQHQNIETKGTPADFKGDNWPKRMAAPCRKDKIWKDDDGEDIYPDCFICDHPKENQRKATQRFWALAVVREQVLENGRVVGTKDGTRTYTRKNDDGEDEEVTEKDIVVVNMAYKNFFALLDGAGSRNGTILDRDYFIKRTGATMNDTSYAILPEDKITTTVDDEQVPFDLRDDALMARYLPEAAEVGYAQASTNAIGEILSDRTSDDFYGRFFDTRVTVPTYAAAEDHSPVATGEPQPAAPSNDVGPDRLQAMKDKLTSYRVSEPELATSGAPRDLG